jgi:glycine hydroxymethyltransferase
MLHILEDDPAMAQLIRKEESRIESTLDLIAAENHAPLSILEAIGSILNTKTIEGYPGRRFHAGCEYVDEIERLAISRAKGLFGAEYVNVQPHSGTSANLAVFFSVLDPGDRVLAMSLPHGGHLSHGHASSITSKCFSFRHYGVDSETGRIDYDNIRLIADEFRPRMIVVGASSYPRLIDYEKMAGIAEDVSAYLFADMAHIGGLVAAKVVPSPVPYCDFVTFTCYKTMMGGRGGVILCREQHGKKIDKAVFPGCQGTSAVNFIAAKAIIFKLALEPQFVEAQRRTLRNAVSLSRELAMKGYGIVTGGTDNHQVIVDLAQKGLMGGEAEQVLESVGIITNRNVIPRDARSPGTASGIRLGAAAVSTRGMGEAEIARIADLIDSALTNRSRKEVLSQTAKRVSQLCRRFPVYGQPPER